jgi:hypothetical protein
MVAFITNSELIILWLLFAVPTAFVYLRYRRKKRNSEAKLGGCLPLAIIASVLGIFLITFSIIDQWRRTQPDKMLSRFLKIDDVSEFHNIRSKFSGGLDYTAWVYFETSAERFKKMVSDLNFERLPDGRPNQAFDFAGFQDAPNLPSRKDAVVYYRKSPDNYDIQYIITDYDHHQGWFVSVDY